MRNGQMLDRVGEKFYAVTELGKMKGALIYGLAYLNHMVF